MKTLTAPGVAWQSDRATTVRFAEPGTLLLLSASLYVALVPSLRLAPALGPYDAQWVLQLGLLVLNAGLLLVSRRLRAAWVQVFADLPQAARLLLAVLFGLGVASALRAPAPHYALLDVAHYALLLALVVSVAALYRRDSRAGSAFSLGVVAVAVVFYLTAVAVGYAFARRFGAPLWPHAGPGFGDVRHFGYFQTLTLPLVVLPALFVKDQSRLVAGLLFGLAACWWALLFASGNWATAAALGAALLLTLAVFHRAARSWALAQAASLAAGALLYVLLFVVPAGAGALPALDPGAASGWLAAWGDTWAQARAHPLLGVGPMHLAAAGGDAVQAGNVALRWLAEWGLPATLVLLAVALWGFRRWVRFARRDHHAHPLVPHRLYLVGLTAVLAAAAVHGLVGGLLVVPFSETLLALAAGWALGLYQQAEIPPARFTAVRTHTYAVGVCLMVALAVGLCAWGLSRDATGRLVRQERLVEATGAATVYPRFRQQGSFIDVPR